MPRTTKPQPRSGAAGCGRRNSPRVWAVCSRCATATRSAVSARSDSAPVTCSRVQTPEISAKAVASATCRLARRMAAASSRRGVCGGVADRPSKAASHTKSGPRVRIASAAADSRSARSDRYGLFPPMAASSPSAACGTVARARNSATNRAAAGWSAGRACITRTGLGLKERPRRDGARMASSRPFRRAVHAEKRRLPRRAFPGRSRPGPAGDHAAHGLRGSMAPVARPHRHHLARATRAAPPHRRWRADADRACGPGVGGFRRSRCGYRHTLAGCDRDGGRWRHAGDFAAWPRGAVRVRLSARPSRAAHRGRGWRGDFRLAPRRWQRGARPRPIRHGAEGRVQVTFSRRPAARAGPDRYRPARRGAVPQPARHDPRAGRHGGGAG